ncbi:MAG: DUF7661 family protein [Geminicoccaceae bacterium]
MRYDIYGKFQLEVVRDGDRWVVYRLDNGKRRMMLDVIVPSELSEDEIETYLDDMLHEWARPGKAIRRIG